MPENPVALQYSHYVVCVQVQLGVKPVIGIAESLFLRRTTTTTFMRSLIGTREGLSLSRGHGAPGIQHGAPGVGRPHDKVPRASLIERLEAVSGNISARVETGDPMLAAG